MFKINARYYVKKFNIKRHDSLCTLCNSNCLGTELHLVMASWNAIAVKHSIELLKMIISSTQQFHILNNEKRSHISLCRNTCSIMYLLGNFQIAKTKRTIKIIRNIINMYNILTELVGLKYYHATLAYSFIFLYFNTSL